MTDYSNILPASDHDLQVTLSSCGATPGHTPYDVAFIQIDDDGDVSLAERTYYGGDGTPMDVWHGRVHWYELASRTDAEWLRESLTNGAIADLIDRIIAGHTVEWDGNNNVGRLTEDAGDASEELDVLLQAAPTSDLVVTDASPWLWGDMGLDEFIDAIADDDAETILAIAERDGVVIRDGLQGIQATLDEARERWRLEHGDDA
jgi:hypothetical protein